MSSLRRKFAAMKLNLEALNAAQLGRYDEAIGLFTQSLQAVPNDAETHHNRGMAFSFQQR